MLFPSPSKGLLSVLPLEGEKVWMGVAKRQKLL